MMQSTQPSRTQQAKMFLSIGKSLAASYIGWTILIAVVVGLVVGLIFAWLVWPVQWTGTRPFLMSDQYKDSYLRFAADSYVSGTAMSDVATRLGDGWTSQEVLSRLDNMINANQPGADRLNRFRTDLATYLSGEGQLGPRPAEPTGATTSPLIWLLFIVVLVAVIVVGYLVMRRVRSEQPTAARVTTGGEGGLDEGLAVETPIAVAVPPVSRAAGGARPVEKTEWAGEHQPPLAQYVTTYALGDDRYDMSFSIETGGGDFLGECGVGISKTIGVGSPDKVTALEVWLFDKNDIRTVTKVLMSEHCFNDPALKAELAPKGEAILARKGEVVTLTTQTLKVNARVDDLVYGTGGLPPSSFFQQATIELAAWQSGG